MSTPADRSYTRFEPSNPATPFDLAPNAMPTPADNLNAGYSNFPDADDEAPGGVPMHVLVQAVWELFKWEESRKAPVQTRADQGWALYTDSRAGDDEFDDCGWKNNRHQPSMMVMVKRTAAKMWAMMEHSNSWFQCRAMFQNKQIFMNFVKRKLMYYFQHPDTMFDEKCRELFEHGLLSAQMYIFITYEVGGIPINGKKQDSSNLEDMMAKYLSSLSHWEDERNPVGDGTEDPFIPNPDMPRLRLEILDPNHVWLDTTGEKKYQMWRTKMSPGALLATAAERGFDIDACKAAIRTGLESNESRVSDEVRKRLGGGMAGMFDEVELLHFEGTLYHPLTGECLLDKEYCIIANGCEMILPPVKMPHWDKQFSVIAAPMLKVPGAVYGKSYLLESIDLYNARHAMFDRILDMINMTLDPPVEEDLDVLDTANIDGEMIKNIRPGTVLPVKRLNGSTGAALIARPIGALDANQMGIIQFMENKMNDYIGIANEASNAPRTRGRITGMEFNARRAEGGELMLDMFQSVEKGLLVPLVQLAFYRMLQYEPQPAWEAWIKANEEALMPDASDQVDPNLVEAWKTAIDKMAAWTPVERFTNLAGFFQFSAEVFSSVVERQIAIEKITYFLQTAKNLPDVQKSIRWDYVLREIARCFGWDEDQVINLKTMPAPPADEEAMIKNTPNSEQEPEEDGDDQDNFFQQSWMGGGGSSQQDDGDTLRLGNSGAAAPGSGAPRQQVPGMPKGTGGF